MAQPIPSVEEGEEQAGGPFPFLEDQSNVGAVAKEVLSVGGAGRAHRSGQTVSLCRPLALRRASVRRPPFDFIRSRNPCVLLRALLEGWRIVDDIEDLQTELAGSDTPMTVPDIQYLALKRAAIIWARSFRCQMTYSASGAPPERARSST